MCRHSQAVLTALLLLVPGVSLAQSVNMGTTFHGLEARARRVVATFPEGSVEVRRGEGQAIEAVFRSRAGRDEGGLTLAAGSRRVQWRQSSGASSEFPLPDQATVSLDWAAHQLHALHEDEQAARADGRAIEVAGDDGAWDGHLRRSRAALGRGVSSGQLAARVQEVETTFDEVIVRASIDRHERRPAGGKRIDYSRFTAAIRDARTGAPRGFVRWFDTAQVLTWKIEGGSQGVVLPERLRGGWTFTPTMGWANVQAYQFATGAASTLDAVTPMAARHEAAPPAAPVPFMLVARAVAPVPALAAGLVGARTREVVSDVLGDLSQRWWAIAGAAGAVRNEPGCDNLHWLDGSIFRACCDVHDKCYETNGCSSSSWWWPFSGSWSCQRCNAQVVYCFCTVSNPAYCGGGGSGSSGGDGGASGGGCTSVAGGFCPVECQSCQAH
ncbi:hypothetical protein TBR22_A27850 [Luteitalea sp. TBR-22]|uniref:hypothetical protein n=1 Tax=Luteitalea sp. TBR-22 TaxID=2802971 RepID=UPI001AF5BF00|nr:hypothetical protein [Luteitalea sp. TBR-22]BCS33558.1 hypothetical protein TBR22_A27850 [Luteitalea sp. TBR-22]